MTKKLFPSALLFLLLSLGCIKSPYYQDYKTIPSYAWKYDHKPSFDFEISDTQAAYYVYFIVRHTNAYPFSNIWLQISTRQPGDSIATTSRIEVPLAEPSGKWMGRGMNEIWEQRMPLVKDGAPMVFNKVGKYSLTLQQDMRMNPLPEVLQVGIRIEKTTRPKKGVAKQ